MQIPLNKLRRRLERWRTPFGKAFSPEPFDKLRTGSAWRSRRVRTGLLLGIALLLGSAGLVLAAIAPDIANTRHNLSASNPITAAAGSSFGTTVKATSETQICVFCHTPHAAQSGGGTGIVAPLWNRTLSTQTYTFYSSSSLDASPLPGAVSPNNPLGGAGTGSKLCLSCHDGTLAIGTVGVLNNAPGNIAMQGTGAGGVMTGGAMGENTGFTRKIGVDLTNDHPISFTYDTAQADRDGELYTPGAAGVAVANRVRGQAVKPQFPLINNQVECITCHDPHLKTDELDPITGELIDNKFLRGNRFQQVSPKPNESGVTAAYDSTKDIMCLACHNKPTWATSTHANVEATGEIYKDSTADLRDFPRNITTWKAACSNCHDMHTVPGSRRLLREATDSPTSPKTAGGTPAIEQVCFQCHSPATDRILVQDTPDQVPDIKTNFTTLPIHMPIVTAEQGRVPPGGGATGNTTEIHDIGVHPTLPEDVAAETIDAKRGKDFVETRTLMGGDLANRHAECTDCHQPHRVTRTVLFNGDPTIPAEKGSHRHGGSNDAGGVPHNNLASGSQRGAFGVEPVYASDSFYDEPVSFIEKRGPVSTAAGSVTAVSTADSTTGAYAVTNTYLTREYQVCAKCHSNYAFGPLLGSIANPSNIPSAGRTGGTPYGANGLRFYTNIFREIQAPAAHKGEGTSATPSGAHKGTTPYSVGPNYAVDFQLRNHRSWHPVMGPTGRTAAIRGNLDPNNWLWPWNADIGVQTMYCTDCHGSKTAPGISKQPTDGSPEGPHGSTNIFLLKGWWDYCTGVGAIAAGCLNNGVASSPGNTTMGVTRSDADPVNGNTTGPNDLCFKCHSYEVYANGLNVRSGFSGTLTAVNGHGHRGLGSFKRCMWCHVAIVHGWKNKAFLVNLNDVGPEALCRQEDADAVPAGYKCTETVGLGNPMPPGTQVKRPSNGFFSPPYYRGAMLKLRIFGISGNWQKTYCGSVGAPGNGATSQTWMDGSEGCSGLP